MHGDQRVSVASLRHERQIELERQLDGALAHDPPFGKQHRYEQLIEFSGKAVRESIWRIAEDQVPAFTALRSRAQEGGYSGPQNGGVLDFQAGQVLPNGPHGGEVRIDEGCVARAPRKRLDSQRPGASVQVEDAHAGDRTEDAEQRLAYAVLRRPRGPAPGRHQAVSLVGSGYDAHSQAAMPF